LKGDIPSLWTGPPTGLRMSWKYQKLLLSMAISLSIDAFAKKHQGGWLSKKRHMQGARLSSNEAYLRTAKQREQLQQCSSW
ncbi:MAG TPA: hypothetical protein VGA63_07780, partial [Geopsychrobacteraceae bacterium]